MAFVKTTWTDNALPAITAAQLNRIETGIGDLHARRIVADVTTVNTYTFSGLAGDAEGPYRLIIAGRINAANADKTLWINPKSATVSSANGRTIQTEEYNEVNDVTTGPQMNKLSNDNYLELGGSRWSLDCDYVCETVVLVDSARRPSHVYSYTITPDVADPRTLGGRGHGRLYAARTGGVNALDFSLSGGGTFTGRIVLEKLGLA